MDITSYITANTKSHCNSITNEQKRNHVLLSVCYRIQKRAM